MTQQLKILMLEDSIVDAEMVERFLKKEHPDYQFHLAKNKETFLLALEQYRPDVILADNSLPQFDAAEALRIVRQQSLHIPFIMVTGTVSEEFAAGIIKAGADDFILKDRLARLPAAVEAALKQQQTEMEKQNAFRKLSESEEKFRCLLESAPDAMVIMDDQSRIQLVNTQTEKLFGYIAGEIIGKNVELLLPDDYRKGPESTGQKKNGQQFPVEISLSPLETAEGLLITAAIRDITERKNAEQALKALELQIMNQRIQEQKRITRAIISAQEQERNRIGQELHDNICQIISTAKLYITVAKEDKPELSEFVDYPIQLIETAIKEIRALSERNVTPLKDINLEDMVQTLVGNLARTTSLKTNFAYQVADHLFDDGLKLNTYRLIQEQLNNIVKHAGAKKVNVSIESEDHFIHVAVSDDGKGFDINQKRNGIGISNMINRVESYNGEIRIESSPGSGCTIRCKFPF
ncbi:MAG TPA: PAS domain S-box protein [Puia sp.]|nr:PAS domain S-box protein [Puia sp.]